MVWPEINKENGKRYKIYKWLTKKFAYTILKMGNKICNQSWEVEYEKSFFVCIGYMFYSLIEIVVDSYYSGKKYGIGLKSQIISIKNSAIMSVLIVLTTLFVSNNISNNYISFILNILMSLIIFIGYSKLFNIIGSKEY